MEKNVCIVTDRLILRTVTLDDIEEVALTWKLYEQPISREEAEKAIRWMQNNHEKNTPESMIHLCLAIVQKEDNKFIGWCGLDNRKESQTAGQTNPILFYLIKEGFWGRGLATEAAKAVLKYSFCNLRLSQVDSGAFADNIGSKRVMEKIGMKYLGLDKNGGHSFTLTRQEYVEKFGCD